MGDTQNDDTLDNVTLAFYSGMTSQEGGKVAALLFALSGPLRGHNYALAPNIVQIGRSTENAIHLPSRSVSSRHCKILRDENHGFSIVDEGSTNGTIVNGRLLTTGEQLQLAHGDSIAICDSLFLFLNPRQTAESDIDDKIEVDFDAAHQEAKNILTQYRNFIGLRRRDHSDED